MDYDSDKFSSTEKVLDKKKGVFSVRGWIKRKRDLKEQIFILLRDGFGEIQCIIEEKKLKNKKQFIDIQKALVESTVIISGTVEADSRAPGGAELKADSVEVISFSEEFPIQRDLSEEFLLEVRHLWLRSKKLSTALKVNATLFKSFRDFMDKSKYVEVQGPEFVSGAVEGGATLFEVPYFGKKVFLSQSNQFYLETFLTGFERVYSIQPSFRAEKSRTRRHLTEFWHAEAEASWMQLNELMKFEEDMIKHMAEFVLEKHPEELKFLGRNPKDLETVVESKFERFSYDEVFNIAQKKFKHLKWGDDLGEKEEREITKDFKVPIIVHHYPGKLKPFYHRPNPEDNGKTVLCTDVLAPEGYGEIIGGGERCWELKEILSRMEAEKINPEPYKWYVDLRRYSAHPHSGFGLGLSRTLTWLCKLEHIRDVIPYPRTMNRYYP
ncbi:MAG: asparagine--tRNA ligase [Candidatus Diapherotrites archaeon]|nr:asparagine--tRNA ligase [Candidatus Diapherotrites archaeon]